MYVRLMYIQKDFQHFCMSSGHLWGVGAYLLPRSEVFKPRSSCFPIGTRSRS